MKRVGEEELLADFDGFGDFVPRGAVRGLEFGIGIDGGAQLLLGGGFLRHQFLVVQSVTAALVSLERVLDAEDIVGGDARIFRRLRGVLMQHLVAAGQQVDHVGSLHILEEVQLGHGELALGAAGISGDKDQIAGLGSGGATT